MTIEIPSTEEYHPPLRTETISNIGVRKIYAKPSTPLLKTSTPTSADRLLLVRTPDFLGDNCRKSLEPVPFLIPRVVPDLKTSFVLQEKYKPAKESEIRYTLNKSSEKQIYVSDLDDVKALPLTSKDLNATISLTERSTFGGGHEEPLKNIYQQKLTYLNDHEKTAAVALLTLKKCSLEVANMTNSWSKIHNIPLCDFIVVQKKCEAMLDNISTLKVNKINARKSESKNMERSGGRSDKTYLKRQKLLSLFRAKSKSASSKSSSIVSLINVIAENGNNSRDLHRRSSSGSGLARSPLSSSSNSLASLELQTPVSIEPSYVPCGNTTERHELNENAFDIHGNSINKNAIKAGKSSKSGKNRNAHMRCLHCSAIDTPEWRKGPKGAATLCNACGLFYKKLVRKFGVHTAGLIMSQRQTESPNDRRVPRNM